MPEVANLPLPQKMLELGVRDMVRVCDGRMSGTAYGTVVLHVAPEAAAGGLLALVQDGDPIVLDVPRRAAAAGRSRGGAGPADRGGHRHRGVRRPGARLGAAVRRPRAAGRHRRRPRLPGRRERTRRREGVTLTAMATGLVRLEIDGEAVWAVRTPEGDRPLRVGLDDLLRSPLDEARAAVESAGAAGGPGRHPARPGGVPGGVGGRRHLRAEPRRPDGGVDRGRRLRPDLRGPAPGGVLQGHGAAGGRSTASRSASAPTRPGTPRSRSSAWCSTPPGRSSATSSATT